MYLREGPTQTCNVYLRQGLTQTYNVYLREGLTQTYNVYLREGLTQTCNVYLREGLTQTCNVYLREGLTQACAVYLREGLTQTCNVYLREGLTQTYNVYLREGLTQTISRAAQRLQLNQAASPTPHTPHLGFVHPLQDVALHQCLPLSSVCCFPVPCNSLLPCYVVLTSPAWSSSWSLNSPWLPLCAAFGPPIVLHSCYMSGPSPLSFQCLSLSLGVCLCISVCLSV